MKANGNKNFVDLNQYNNPLVDKIAEMERKLEQAVKLAKKIDSEDGYDFPGKKFFKFGKP